MLPQDGARVASPSRGVLIVQEVRPDVVEIHAEPMRKTFRDRCLQRVVIRNTVVYRGRAIPAGADGSGINRVRSKLVVASRRRRVFRYRVDVGRKREIETVAAHIGKCGHVVSPQLPLNPEVPLIDFRDGCVVRVINQRPSTLPIEASRVCRCGGVGKCGRGVVSNGWIFDQRRTRSAELRDRDNANVVSEPARRGDRGAIPAPVLSRVKVYEYTPKPPRSVVTGSFNHENPTRGRTVL